jgi:hypothetical protein
LRQFVERVGLLLTATVEKKQRITFAVIDVDGDGVIGDRDVFFSAKTSNPNAKAAELSGKTSNPNELYDVFFSNAGEAASLELKEAPFQSLEVSLVTEGGAAQHQGVREGDRLVRVDGLSTMMLTLMDVRRMRWNAGGRSLHFEFQRAQKDKHSSTDSGTLSHSDLGNIFKMLREHRTTTKIRVSLISAAGLRRADMGGLGQSDPYCIFNIPGKPHLTFQTKHVDDNLSPVWNEERELADYMLGEQMRFVVKDHDMGSKPDESLGHVAIALSSETEAFEGTLALQEAGKGITATLRVRVTPIGKGGLSYLDFARACGRSELFSFYTSITEVLTGLQPTIEGGVGAAAPPGGMPLTAAFSSTADAFT